MRLRVKKAIFFSLWLFVVVVGPITVFRNTSISFLTSDSIYLANFFQRLTGLLAFSLIFCQIMLGAYMNKFIEFLGGRAFKIHLIQGLVTYGLILIHPLFQNLIVYYASKSFTQALLTFMPSLETQKDILLVYGKVAFLFSTIAVFAAYFRTKAFFRKNWRAFHILNYLVFYLIFVHARVGTDSASQPFESLYWTSFILVTGTVFNRFGFPFVKKILSKKSLAEKVFARK